MSSRPPRGRDGESLDDVLAAIRSAVEGPREIDLDGAAPVGLPAAEEPVPPAPEPVTPAAEAASLPPLDDAAREMLRPMIAAWLDRHLPDMVQQIALEEIRRRLRRD